MRPATLRPHAASTAKKPLAARYRERGQYVVRHLGGKATGAAALSSSLPTLLSCVHLFLGLPFSISDCPHPSSSLGGGARGERSWALIRRGNGRETRSQGGNKEELQLLSYKSPGSRRRRRFACLLTGHPLGSAANFADEERQSARRCGVADFHYSPPKWGAVPRRAPPEAPHRK